jgi:hypothetical protein
VTATVHSLPQVPHLKEKYLTILHQLQDPSEGGEIVPVGYIFFFFGGGGGGRWVFFKFPYIFAFCDIYCRKVNIFWTVGFKVHINSWMFKLKKKIYLCTLLSANEVATCFYHEI